MILTAGIALMSAGFFMCGLNFMMFLVRLLLLFLVMSPSMAADKIIQPPNKITAYIIKQVNSYRSSLGLSLVHTSEETCAFSAIRAKEIAFDFSHQGFERRKKSRDLPYTSWHVITENIAMTSDYTQVEKMWENSSGHARNMREDTPYVCVMQYGDYFAYVGLKP